LTWPQAEKATPGLLRFHLLADDFLDTYLEAKNTAFVELTGDLYVATHEADELATDR
jgi:hypothetical protein